VKIKIAHCSPRQAAAKHVQFLRWNNRQTNMRFWRGIKQTASFAPNPAVGATAQQIRLRAFRAKNRESFRAIKLMQNKEFSRVQRFVPVMKKFDAAARTFRRKRRRVTS
jgi:hypothetical protein